MKTLCVCLVATLMGVVLAYSLTLYSSVRALERRVSHTEKALSSHAAPREHTQGAESALSRFELTSPIQVGTTTSANESKSLEERVSKLENQIKPHLEILPFHGNVSDSLATSYMQAP